MADQILVQGAAAVAQAEGVGKLAQAEAGTALGAFIAEGVSKVVQERNKRFNANFNNAMKAELARDPGTSDKEYDAMYKKLNRKRFAYVYLNKKDRALAERDLRKEGENVAKNEGFKKDIARKGGDLGDDGDNNALKKDMTEIMNGNKKLITKGDKSGYMMTNPDANKYDGMTFSEAFAANRNANKELHGNDYSKWTNFMWAGEKTGGKLKEFHPYTTGDIDKRGAKLGGSVKFEKEIFQSQDEINGKVDENTMDGNAKEGIEGIINGAVDKATNWKEGDSFNYQKTFNNVRNNVIENGKLKSLARDKIFGGRSFKKDLKAALRTETYENLGIPKELVDKLDPTDNGKITRRDARRIYKEIAADEDMLKDYLAEYYTKAVEQNYNNSLSDEAKAYVPPKSKPRHKKSTTTIKDVIQSDIDKGVIEKLKKDNPNLSDKEIDKLHKNLKKKQNKEATLVGKNKRGEKFYYKDFKRNDSGEWINIKTGKPISEWADFYTKNLDKIEKEKQNKSASDPNEFA